MDYACDAKVNNIGDQYMFGNALMICPVYKYEARSREVYFPSTTGWYDFYTGEYVRGGQTVEVSAPYERMPIYVCEGAIIPCEEAMQYTSERMSDNVTLYVYAGKDGKFTLYEDEGVNYNYEKGKYTKIEFTYDETAKTLVIGERQGEYEGMLKERTFNVVYVNADAPKAFDVKAAGEVVRYDGSKVVVKF